MRISDWSSDVCSSDLLDQGIVMLLMRLGPDPLLLEVADGAFVIRHGPFENLPVELPAADAGRAILVGVVELVHRLGHVVDEVRVLTGVGDEARIGIGGARSEEHTSELQSLMRISYAVFCLKKKKQKRN